MPEDKDTKRKKDEYAVSEENRGAHPARPISEADDAGANKKYADNEDKPDPTTVAQVEVTE